MKSSVPLAPGAWAKCIARTTPGLDRTVAIKILPAHLSERPELRQRFEREAKTIASLNHPHICVIYDIGREGEIDFLVMEYVEGETLSDRLMKATVAA